MLFKGSSQAKLTLKNKGAYYLVELPARVGQREADALLGIRNHLEKRPGSNVVLDFSQTGFLDSRSLGQVVLLNTAVQKSGGRLVLAGVPQRISSVIAHTGMNGNFTQLPDLETAINHFLDTPGLDSGRG